MLLDLAGIKHPTILASPTNLAKTSNTTTTITMGWINGSGSVVVEVWRDGVLLTTLAAGTTTFTDTGRTIGVVYAYQVRHTAVGSYSPWSNLAPLYTQLPIPGTPVVSSTDGLVSEVTLTWTNTTVLLDGIVYRDGSPYSTFAAGDTSWAEGTLTPATYVYKLAYTFLTDTGTASGTASAVVTGTVVTPTGFGLTAIGPTEIDLAWTNVTSGSTVNVYRDTSANPTTLLASTGVNATGYADTAVSAGTAYFYKVAAAKNGGESTHSADQSLRAPLIAPSGLGYSLPFTDRVTLTWTVGDPTATTEIYRGGVLLDTVGTTVATYNDDSVAQGTAYTYKIRHVNGGGGASFFTANLSLITDDPSLSSQSVTMTVGATDCTLDFVGHGPRGATYNLETWTSTLGDSGGPDTGITSPHTVSPGFTMAAKNPGVTRFFSLTFTVDILNSSGTVVASDDSFVLEGYHT